MLNHYLLADEDYILARYVSILKKKKIQTVEDLLFDFPIKYEDYTIHSIHDAILDVPTILEGTIVSKVTVNYLKTNDKEAAFKLQEAFKKYLGEDRVEKDYQPMSASEDFSNIPNAFGIPYVFWGFGAYNKKEDILPNHNPAFAPDLHPTMETGTEAAIVAAMSYLEKNDIKKGF